LSDNLEPIDRQLFLITEGQWIAGVVRVSFRPKKPILSPPAPVLPLEMIVCCLFAAELLITARAEERVVRDVAVVGAAEISLSQSPGVFVDDIPLSDRDTDRNDDCGRKLRGPFSECLNGGV
jgi:hypothetical protein